MDNLSRPGTYAGQDSLVAFARLHRVNIIIHQLNSPLWQIEGGGGENARELHLSYHNGEHYSSVRRIGDFADTPAQVRLAYVSHVVSLWGRAFIYSYEDGVLWGVLKITGMIFMTRCQIGLDIWNNFYYAEIVVYKRVL